MSNQPPIEVPQGAIRLNTDSQKLEFLHRIDGMRWRLRFVRKRWKSIFQLVGSWHYNRDFITIATRGNGIDFGDLTVEDLVVVIVLTLVVELVQSLVVDQTVVVTTLFNSLIWHHCQTQLILVIRREVYMEAGASNNVLEWLVVKVKQVVMLLIML